MSNLAIKDTSAIANVGWSSSQIQLIKSQLITKGGDKDPGPSDDELAYYWNVCKVTGLSPFRRQIYAIRRWDKGLGGYKMAIQVGIGGLRAIASRTGQYAGSDEPLFDEGLSAYEMKRQGRSPVAAKVTVYRLLGGVRCPFVGIALADEFKQNSPLWGSMPFNQLAKCAESQALSKAFPEEVAGLELSQEDAPGGEFGGDRTPPSSYHNSRIWLTFEAKLREAMQSQDAPQKLEILENWALSKVAEGTLPAIARNAIESEIRRALEIMRDRHGAPMPTPEATLIDVDVADEF
ncbi:phage recombination protein Bet [Thermoleptolyngbya sp. M55_K2018_002]|uniref:phage recombination protein Bet n=1 Tax=Thermoleptolyngbya sp. M55_K2018_002 TaxID=2747808 RepID=UPI0019F38D80|nr:phage recombination protein Bet [Thermoleptolyngbya sp. M55_K2018_002]HIK40407.1 phage recombination protein Bet [Thermoleptolyngbya sp. M55_K2018_002]